ncbi:MAG: hypothetical protein ACT4OM_10815 [Actinomycetota bacterium]
MHPGMATGKSLQSNGWRLLLSCLVALAGMLVAQAAFAATGRPDVAELPVFGIRADLFGLTELPNEHFSYGLEAGTGVADAAVFYNFTDQPLTLRVYPADVDTAEGGGLAPAQADEAMSGVGGWVSTESDEVTVPAGGEAPVRFSLEVPAGTVPGDYVGAIVGSLVAAPVEAGGLRVETRVARLIRLSVPGDPRLGVSLSQLGVSRNGKTEEFSLTVKNIGNVLFLFDGALIIEGGGANLIRQMKPDGIYVIPGGEAVIKGTWNNMPVLGRRTAVAQLLVTAGDQPPRTFVSDPLKLTYFPVRLALAIGLVLLLLAVVLVVTRRRWLAFYRRRRDIRVALRMLRDRMEKGSATSTLGQEPASLD